MQATQVSHRELAGKQVFVDSRNWNCEKYEFAVMPLQSQRGSPARFRHNECSIAKARTRIMRRYVSYALIAIALLTFIVWAVSQFIQPILPASTNAGFVLFVAALIGVVGILGQFKDVVELFHAFDEHSGKLPNAITGPVQVILGNVTVNVTYIVQGTSVELVDVSTTGVQSKIPTSKEPVPRQAPPVPPDLTGRATEIATLKQILLQKSQTVGLVGLRGMGGIGKTTLAAVLAHDPDIEQEFSDGTLWAYVGRFRDVREILSQWISALNPQEPMIGSSNTTQLLYRFRTLTQTRRILLVLDDVDKETALQIQPIIQSIGPMCKVLITSRAVSLSGVQTLVSLDVLPEIESLLLLGKEIGRKFTARERALAREIVFSLGYHPLALRLAGALIRESNIGLDEYRKKFRVEIERARTLDEVREQSVSSIRKSLDYSYNRLSVEQRTRLRQLAVFAAENFDKKAAVDAWNIDLSSTENLLSIFVTTAFLNLKDGFYRMHPLVYEYLKGLSNPPCQ
jgi:hypothetical protein